MTEIEFDNLRKGDLCVTDFWGKDKAAKVIAKGLLTKTVKLVLKDATCPNSEGWVSWFEIKDVELYNK